MGPWGAHLQRPSLGFRTGHLLRPCVSITCFWALLFRTHCPRGLQVLPKEVLEPQLTVERPPRGCPQPEEATGTHRASWKMAEEQHDPEDKDIPGQMVRIGVARFILPERRPLVFGWLHLDTSKISATQPGSLPQGGSARLQDAAWPLDTCGSQKRGDLAWGQSPVQWTEKQPSLPLAASIHRQGLKSPAGQKPPLLSSQTLNTRIKVGVYQGGTKNLCATEQWPANHPQHLRP